MIHDDENSSKKALRDANTHTDRTDYNTLYQ